MLKKIFGGKKSAYFLELDENKNLESVKEKAEELAKPVKEKAEELAKPVKEKAEALARSVKEKAEPAKTAKTEASKAVSAQTKKTSVKDNAKTAPAQAESAPKVSKPTISDPEEIVRAAVFKNSSSNGKADSQTNGFASNNVIVPTMSRRRPGPSLNMFKNMARQAKTPKN